MTTQEFFTVLDARIAKYDLLCHLFYKAWSAGELTREDLRNYGQNYFHHVNAFPEYLQEFASRLPQGDLRRAVMANHDDETGLHGSRPHSRACARRFSSTRRATRSRSRTSSPESSATSS